MRFALFPLVAAFVGAAPALAQDSASVTGAVSYRQKIALTARARLEVQLAEVSRTDGPGRVIAKQVVQPAGQVPIRFELTYDPAQIRSKATYTVQARIYDGASLQFASPSPVRVITHGRPTRVDLVVERVGGATEPSPKPRQPAAAPPPALMHAVSGTFARGDTASVYQAYFVGAQPVRIDERQDMGDRGNASVRYLFDQGRLIYVQEAGVLFPNGERRNLWRQFSFDGEDRLTASRQRIDNREAAATKAEAAAALAQAKALLAHLRASNIPANKPVAGTR